MEVGQGEKNRNSNGMKCCYGGHRSRLSLSGITEHQHGFVWRLILVLHFLSGLYQGFVTHRERFRFHLYCRENFDPTFAYLMFFLTRATSVHNENN